MGTALKGITSITRNGTTYWYARVNGRRVYCGKDKEGKELAEAARKKYDAERYERRQRGAGIKVTKVELRTIKELADWYMQLPAIQKLEAYDRMVDAVANLYKYFGKSAITQAESEEQDRYRQWRREQGAQDSTVDYEIGILRRMFKKAIKAKKTPPDILPGEFNMVCRDIATPTYYRR